MYLLISPRDAPRRLGVKYRPNAAEMFSVATGGIVDRLNAISQCLETLIS